MAKTLPRYLGILTAGLLIFSFAGRLAAADDPKSTDQRLFVVLRDVINQGADLYNTGDHSGCYSFSRGALMLAGPQLSHPPDAKKSIESALTNAAKRYEPAVPLSPERKHDLMGRGAFALRKVL